jgi:hypothetical protein
VTIHSKMFGSPTASEWLVAMGRDCLSDLLRSGIYEHTVSNGAVGHNSQLTTKISGAANARPE